MYRTSEGERILLGAERQLFENSLGMMIDLLSCGDAEFGVTAFDELQRGQKLYALYRAGRALLAPDEPAPELTAYIEASVAAIYHFALSQVIQEIEDPEFDEDPFSWRKRASNAVRDLNDVEEFPAENCTDISEWQVVFECLEGAILWDNDFEMQAGLDVSPEESDHLKQILGITDNYFIEVPFEVPDAQINLYLDALKGLTPGGRK